MTTIVEGIDAVMLEYWRIFGPNHVPTVLVMGQMAREMLQVVMPVRFTSRGGRVVVYESMAGPLTVVDPPARHRMHPDAWFVAFFDPSTPE